MKTPNEFTLNCSDESFLKRQKNVFNQLFEIEKITRHSQDECMELEGHSTSREHKEPKTQRSYTRPFRGKESIFKMPTDAAPRHFLKRLPDYKKNPHKWTKYSLEDVKDEDMSDKGNTKAALSFLKQLNDRSDKRTLESLDDDVEELPKKILFQRHISSTSTTEVGVDEKPSFRSSKIVMPEYVIGQKIKKERKNRSIKNKIDPQTLKLDHLFEEDDQGE